MNNRTPRILRIFLASPSDVLDERDAIEEVVSELNEQWGDTLSLRLELVRFETGVAPNMGADPQSVVNDQLGDDYDIFIGVLWKHFGTPTPRAESGTKEEFDRAYQRLQSDPDSLKIMLYFKEGGPNYLHEIELDQLAKIRAFKTEIKEAGLYGKFDRTEDLTTLVRLHLGKHLRDWGTTWGLNSIAPREARKVALPNSMGDGSSGIVSLTIERKRLIELDDDQDEGYLEIIERTMQGFERMSSSIQNITSYIAELGSNITNRADEISGSMRPNDQGWNRRLIDRASTDIRSFSDRTEAELPHLSSAIDDTFDGLSKAVLISVDFYSDEEAIAEDLTKLKDSVLEMSDGVSFANNSLAGLRSSIRSAPRLTTRLNRAKKVAVKSIDELSAEFERVSGLAFETVAVIDDLLNTT